MLMTYSQKNNIARKTMREHIYSVTSCCNIDMFRHYGCSLHGENNFIIKELIKTLREGRERKEREEEREAEGQSAHLLRGLPIPRTALSNLCALAP